MVASLPACLPVTSDMRNKTASFIKRHTHISLVQGSCYPGAARSISLVAGRHRAVAVGGLDVCGYLADTVAVGVV